MRKPRLVVVVDPNGSGKMSITEKLLRHEWMEKCEYINPNVIAQKKFVNKKSHSNGIGSFWGYAKHRLQKFKGLKSEYFDLHLKETEFRFNNRKQDLYKVLLEEFRLKFL
jgi:hypothetical protein